MHLNISLLLLSAFLCSISTGLTAQTFTVDNGDTINVMTKDSVKVGLWREYYKATGNIKSEVYYTNGKKDGLELTWYNVPHCMQSESTYKNGQLEGPAYKYSRWCNKEKEENFVNGKTSGWQREFHANGRVKTEGKFKEGELVGHYKVYNDDGKFIFESKSTETTLTVKDTTATQINANMQFARFITAQSAPKVLIVTDITGSMYPYARKVVNWFEEYLKTHTEEVHFVFFNDGNGKPDNQKQIGNIGGIYTLKTNSLQQLIATMSQAARAGQGGDAPENNCEAIIKGLKFFPEATEIIMIADNDAPVKDIKLANKINIPITVILCGLGRFDLVQEDYILLAYNTKGSLHSFTEDIKDFKGTPIGDQMVEVRDQSYAIKNGKIYKY